MLEELGLDGDVSDVSGPDFSDDNDIGYIPDMSMTVTKQPLQESPRQSPVGFGRKGKVQVKSGSETSDRDSDIGSHNTRRKKQRKSRVI